MSSTNPRRAGIRGIATHLPEHVYDNAALARDFPGLDPEKVLATVGIARRTIAAPDEFASDLACDAARSLFATCGCSPGDVDYVIFCSQSPDYPLPPTACLIQAKLGLPTHCGAIDVNLGCSGYIYALGLAAALIESGQIDCALVLTADTLSKFLAADDASVRTIFGDGAAATLVTHGHDAVFGELGPWCYGTDGRGGPHLIVRDGLRGSSETPSTSYRSAAGSDRFGQPIRMHGAEVFAFTLKAVPALVEELLQAASLGPTDVDLFIFHQANRMMLDTLRKRLKIPEDRFVYHLEDQGNTCSASVPLALAHAIASGRFQRGMTAALVGYGVGYSWGATLLRWQVPAGSEGVHGSDI